MLLVELVQVSVVHVSAMRKYLVGGDEERVHINAHCVSSLLSPSKYLFRHRADMYRLEQRALVSYTVQKGVRGCWPLPLPPPCGGPRDTLGPLPSRPKGSGCGCTRALFTICFHTTEKSRGKFPAKSTRGSSGTSVCRSWKVSLAHAFA